MNLPPPGVGCDYGRVTPSLCHTQHPANSNESNPAERHLSFAESCSDNRGQRPYLATVPSHVLTLVGTVRPLNQVVVTFLLSVKKMKPSRKPRLKKR